MAISAPIMLGSAVQIFITLTDSVFLFHLSEVDFGSIGFVGSFYLVVAAIGFGFSKGGQIMIARRLGENRPAEVGRTFYAMLYFEMGLAVLMFLFLYYGTPYFFTLFADSQVVYQKSLDYLEYRSFGVFFSYCGVAIIALYTGAGRTNFIVVDTLILFVVNVVFNYSLIFGHWGLPAMGIAGAGLASTIAEIVAFIVFFIYILFDKEAVEYKLFTFPTIDWKLIKQQQRIAAPIVAQAVVGLGSAFVFYSIVENLGERTLAINNLVRNVYLFLSIPCWGFASGINTLVSNLIGQNQRRSVLPAIWKTAKISLIWTLVLSLPIILFPEQMLYPVLGSEDMSLITDARPTLYVLIGVLAFFSVGGVYFNGLAGTGATFYGLKIQFWCALGYLLFIYIVVEFTDGGLELAWTSEIFYWIAIIALCISYLHSPRWFRLRV